MAERGQAKEQMQCEGGAPAGEAKDPAHPSAAPALLRKKPAQDQGGRSGGNLGRQPAATSHGESDSTVVVDVVESSDDDMPYLEECEEVVVEKSKDGTPDTKPPAALQHKLKERLGDNTDRIALVMDLWTAVDNSQFVLQRKLTQCRKCHY
eukprot:m.137483 g.137483  ORF g.137483 m.137483 type:complete len:151 (+) comp22684_c0_seq3:120-572(+)